MRIKRGHSDERNIKAIPLAEKLCRHYGWQLETIKQLAAFCNYRQSIDLSIGLSENGASFSQHALYWNAPSEEIYESLCFQAGPVEFTTLSLEAPYNARMRLWGWTSEDVRLTSQKVEESLKCALCICIHSSESKGSDFFESKSITFSRVNMNR